MFASLDEGEAKNKITRDAGYTMEKLSMEMISKKLQGEDKKNVKDGGKSGSGLNSTSNKAKSVNAVAKGSNKTPAGKPASSGAKKNKMGGMDNGVCPVGKKLIDAPRCSVDGCKDRAHWGWCDKKGCTPAG